MDALNRTKLSVNINKLATIRNARGRNNPDIITYAKKIESYGADGITVHPRPDQRHIRFEDLYLLKDTVKKELNIEGYPGREFMNLIMEICPQQVTLVPDAADVLTSNNGWNTKMHQDFLKDIISELKSKKIRCSIFLNPDPRLIASAVLTGTDRIELYTEAYASGFHVNKGKAIRPYIETANEAIEAGLEINAGHDLDLKNLAYFQKHIRVLSEVSIGHALICDALEFGMANTVKMYLNQLGGSDQ